MRDWRSWRLVSSKSNEASENSSGPEENHDKRRREWSGVLEESGFAREPNEIWRETFGKAANGGA